MLTIGFVTDPEHWRERAEDIRLTASSLKGEHAKARMLKIAEGYEALRRQTEERITDEPTCASLRLLFTLNAACLSRFRGLAWVGRRW